MNFCLQIDKSLIAVIFNVFYTVTRNLYDIRKAYSR